MGYSIGSSTFILNQYQGAQAAYALRKLRSDYNGPCIRVQRTTDSAQKDIGFFRYTLDTDDLLRFAGTGSAKVITWYDQSTYGVNINSTIHASTPDRPYAVTSGSLHYEGTELVLSCPNYVQMNRVSGPVTLTDWTIYQKGKSSSLYNIYVNGGYNTEGLIQHNGQGLSYYYGGYIAIAGGAGSYSTSYRKIQAKRNSTTTNVRGYVNGINLGNNNVAGSLILYGTGVLYGQIFGTFAGAGYSGSMRECIIYPVEHDDDIIKQINTAML